jgi:hypothetical protein
MPHLVASATASFPSNSRLALACIQSAVARFRDIFNNMHALFIVIQHIADVCVVTCGAADSEYAKRRPPYTGVRLIGRINIGAAV